MVGPARGFGQNGKSVYMNVTKPMFVFCNFIVDSTNGNGFGVRSVKSNGYVDSVKMTTSAGLPAGTPNMGTARDFAILGAAAVTNVGSSVLTGNMGIFPGTSITGFPPGSFTGALHVADVAASTAKASAQAVYTALQAKTPTGINSALNGQTLTPGTYKATSGTAGTFTIDAATGPLTLNGAGIYVFQTSTTLITGTTGAGVITLTGGARAQDIFWVVGSSATLNSATASDFQGTVIALTSITDTVGGVIKGGLIALNGAVTLSGASTISPVLAATAFGTCQVRMSNNFNTYLGGFSGFVSPVSGVPLAVSGASLVVGQPVIIVSVGTTPLADWVALGLPAGIVPAVGCSFIAATTGSVAGSGVVMAPSVSGVNSVEVIGNPNVMMSGANVLENGGAVINLQFLSNGVPTAPKDGSVVGMTFIFDGSSVSIDGL